MSQIPSGFLVTNIGDMAKWLSFHLNLTSQLKVKPVTSIGDNRFHYFGGWMFSKDIKSIYHEGNLPTYSGYTWMDQKNKIAVSVLANSNTSNNISLVKEIVSLLKKENIQPAETDINRLTDRISSILILVGLLWVAGMLMVIIIRLNKIKKEKYQFKQTIFPKIASGVLFILALLLVYGSTQIPKLINPAATWDYVYEWLPITAIIAIALLTIALLLSIIMVFLFMCFSQNRKTGSN
ncbi:serine hydrolase [Shimazuella kribbensis]|uniref:serine hydrolase n=1 Tax=Shimazuella kribbensis TaxID=139808 RepID=UPI0012EC6F7C|nr:serine hydrolase [Shimazuella kribbensis]